MDSAPDAFADDGPIDAAPDVFDTSTTVDDSAVDATVIIPVDAEVRMDVSLDDVAVDARDEGATPLPCDETGAPSTEGKLTISATADFHGLCGGDALIGDRVGNRIVRIALATGAIATTYPLTAAPHSLALDAKRQLLYVTLYPATKLARVNLVTSAVTYIELSLTTKRLALGPDGQVLALAETYPDPAAVLWVDGVGGRQLGIKTVAAASTRAAFIAFVPTTSTLFLGDNYSTASEFARYTFSASSPLLTLQQKASACYFGVQLAISPDGSRLAFACGGGNAAGYTVSDFAANDLSVTSGEWVTGAYPRGAAFSPDGAYFGSANSYVLQLFGAASHTLLKSSTISSCGTSLNNVHFSHDGKLLIGMTACTGPSTNHQLVWMPVP